MHIYACNKGMGDRYFYNADGEMLIVPEMGRLGILTELGAIQVGPGSVAVMPRGLKFRVEPAEVSEPDREHSGSRHPPDDGSRCRGYICENYGQQFRLPDLGPIGANGLANPRDFETPVAWYEDREGDSRSSRNSAEIFGRARRIIRRSTSSHGTATTLRTDTTCGDSTRSARSRSIIPTRRSSPC